MLSVSRSRVTVRFGQGERIFSLRVLQRGGKFIPLNVPGAPPYLFLAADSESVLYAELGQYFHMEGPGLAQLSRAEMPFLGSALEKGYRQGLLGEPRVHRRGRAEARLGASVLLMGRCISAVLAETLRRPRLDALTVAYTPCIDTVQHELAFAPGRRSGSGAIEWVDKVYRATDRQLQLLRDHSANPIVIVSSDHGYSEISGNILVNVALRRAGLLRTAPGGGIDFAASLAYYHPANDGTVWFSGIGEKHSAVQRVAQVLRGLRDPRTGKRVIAHLYSRQRDNPERWCNPHGADMCLIPARGYNPSASVTTADDWLVPAHKASNHLTANGDRKLDAIVACNDRALVRRHCHRADDIRLAFHLAAAALGAGVGKADRDPRRHPAIATKRSLCAAR